MQNPSILWERWLRSHIEPPSRNADLAVAEGAVPIGPSQTYAASMAAPPGRANAASSEQKEGFRLSDRGRRVRRVRLEVAGPVRVFVRLRPPAERHQKGRFGSFRCRDPWCHDLQGRRSRCSRSAPKDKARESSHVVPLSSLAP